MRRDSSLKSGDTIKSADLRDVVFEPITNNYSYGRLGDNTMIMLSNKLEQKSSNVKM